MGNINFFVNWELWEQMTFVLAVSIVLVFLAGLLKLWWINRSVRKHEILDEEKRSRLSEMRKSGLPVGKKADIPFGVRAIQSGIQVDGIWISRPGTPNSGTLATSMTLGGDSDDEPKGKEKAMSPKIATPSPGQSQRPSPTASTFEQAHSPTLDPQSTYRPKHGASKPPNWSSNHLSADLQRNLDALRNLEGASSPSRPAPQSYTPTTSFPPARTSAGQGEGRTSSSSDEGLTLANTRHNSRMASPLTQTPQASSHARGGESRSSYFTVRQASPDDAQQRRPAAAASETEHPSAPTRSYSGDVHANRATRRVNAGFEVLPAGTFGVPPPANDDQTDLESGSNRFPPPVTNKLHRKSRSRSSSRA
ncbi:hypothetical protein PG985_006644 [Apiospora marii]|uniref:uncharacterized protein n=1 Tax=Apiospora marii TaxID=335849 RepID=UPI0031300AF5